MKVKLKLLAYLVPLVLLTSIITTSIAIGII